MPIVALNSHLGVRRIGDTLTFYAQTLNASGAAVDADVVPTYRIYEEETGAAIATGSMALLDFANTDGFYSEQITLASATGYEFNKDYAIWIAATIANVASAAIYTLKIGPETALFSGLASAGAAGSITLTGAVATSDLYNGLIVAILSGAGAGQARIISDYDGGTLVASVVPNWITNPGATSVYAIYPHGAADLRMWLGAVPNGLVSSRVDTTVGAMQANVLTDTAINGDAITAAKVAADVSTEIWSAAARTLTAATNITSTGAAVPITAGGLVSADATAISTGTAAADELEAILVGPGGTVTVDITGSLSGSVGSVTGAVGSVTGNVGGNVNGNVVGSVGSVVGNVGGNVNGNVVGSVGSVTGSVGSVVAAVTVGTNNDKTDYRLSATGVDDIWDEDIVAGVATADTAREVVSQLTKRAVVLATELVDGSILGQLADDGVATYDRTTDSLQAIRDAVPGTAPSAADNANAVWDETTAEARVVGSYGQLIKDDIDATVSSRASAAALALVQADTNDIQARLPAALVGTRMDSSVGAMANDVITAAALAADAGEEIIAAVSGTADAGSTALTIVDAARTEADVDYWKESLVYMTSGPAAGQIRRISAFNPALDTITVDTAFTQPIAAGNAYLILRTAMGSPAAAAATDWTAGERTQIRQALGVTGAVAATDGTGDLKTLTAALQADTDDLQIRAADIQGRLPGSLSGGRMRSQVEGMDPATVTPAAVATDAIDADALAADAVAEIVAAMPAAPGAAAVAAAVWQSLKSAHQGETIMGNIAEDTDNQEFEIRPG